MHTEIDIYRLVDELALIQGRILVLESLYTKFVNLPEAEGVTALVQAEVGDQLRNERRKLVSALNEWIGALS